MSSRKVKFRKQNGNDGDGGVGTRVQEAKVMSLVGRMKNGRDWEENRRVVDTDGESGKGLDSGEDGQ